MKKKALVITAMVFASTALCAPAFAAEYGGSWYNGVAIGEVGTFTTGSRADITGNTVTGLGAFVDDRSTNFNVLGHVGEFGGGANANTINMGIGAQVGWTDGAVANGHVGIYNNYTNANTIGIGVGAQIDAGTNNRATGTVGSFDNSFKNKLTDIWVNGQWVGDKWVEAHAVGSVGALIENGSNNIATGNVGLFQGAGSLNIVGNYAGNTVEASQGARIINGSYNVATGDVGIFNGTSAATSTGQSNVSGNFVKSSTGAYIGGGDHNTATGTVGSFKAGAMPSQYDSTSNMGPGNFGWTAGMTANEVQGTGAAVMGGSYNKAYGTVGMFTGSADFSFSRYNMVNGTGALIQGGSNNLAIGSVGTFISGNIQNNKVTGSGVVISH